MRGLSPVTLVLNTVIRAVVDCGEINKYHTTADAAATAYGVQAREAPRRARATGAGESGTVCVFFALASGSWVWLCLRVCQYCDQVYQSMLAASSSRVEHAIQSPCACVRALHKISFSANCTHSGTLTLNTHILLSTQAISTRHKRQKESTGALR